MSFAACGFLGVAYTHYPGCVPLAAAGVTLSPAEGCGGCVSGLGALGGGLRGSLPTGVARCVCVVIWGGGGYKVTPLGYDGGIPLDSGEEVVAVCW